MNIDIKIVPHVLVGVLPPSLLLQNWFQMSAGAGGRCPGQAAARVTNTGEIEAMTATTAFTEAIYIYLPGATTD